MRLLLKVFKHPLFWIFILALVLRVYKLGEFPYGFHVDEVKVAWNSVSILKTGTDDHNNKLKLYYDSFGDFRPVGIFYFTIPSIFIFGNNEFATRFSVAFFGALTILPIYLLTTAIENNKKLKTNKRHTNVGYLSAIILALSPWGINISRATNETTISTFFAIFALYFFIKFIKTKKVYLGFLTIIIITISYFLYHSVKLLAPIFFLITLIYYFNEIKTKKVKKFGVIIVVLIFLLTAVFSFTNEGVARLGQVSIFKDVDTLYQIQRIKKEDLSKNIFSTIFDNNIIVYSKRFIDSYFQYFSANFLISSLAKPFRFATPGFGLITYIDLILILFGLIQIIRGNKSILPFILLIIAPLPAAITVEDTPNLSRAFFMLPFLVLIEAYGLEKLMLSNFRFNKLLYILIFLIFITNYSYYLHLYYYHSISHRPYLQEYVGDSPTYRGVGAKELSLKLDGLKSKYDKIIITNFPDSLYPWYAYFNNKNPAEFNKTYSLKTNERIYDNIIFSESKCPSENSLIKYSKQNILIIDSWECPFESQITNGYPLKIVGRINRPDDTTVYTLMERDWAKPLLFKGVYY